MRVSSYQELLSLQDSAPYDNITVLELHHECDMVNEVGGPVTLPSLPAHLVDLYIVGPLTELPALPNQSADTDNW